MAERVRAVISGGDRAAMFLYAHYLRARSSAGEEGVAPDAERLQLERLAAELESALDPEARGRLEKAQAELAELRKIKDYAYVRRHGARDAVELYLNKAYGATYSPG